MMETEEQESHSPSPSKVHRVEIEAVHFGCPDCGFQAKSASGLRLHRRRHDNNNNNNSHSKPSPKTSEKNVEVVVEYACPFCDHVSNRKEGFKEHVTCCFDARAPPPADPPVVMFLCPLCDLEAVGKESLKKHFQENHSFDSATSSTLEHVHKFECEICGSDFVQVEDLVEHLDDVHGDQTKKKGDKGKEVPKDYFMIGERKVSLTCKTCRGYKALDREDLQLHTFK